MYEAGLKVLFLCVELLLHTGNRWSYPCAQ